jgi:hypothetical protein
MNTNEETFTINVDGSKTATNYSGKFTAIKFLSFADELAIDALRRSLLSNAVGIPTERIANAAELLANVGIRVTEGPSWFMDADRGVTLKDDEPLAELYSKCLEVSKKALDAVKTKAEEAKKNLTKQDSNEVA